MRYNSEGPTPCEQAHLLARLPPGKAVEVTAELPAELAAAVEGPLGEAQLRLRPPSQPDLREGAGGGTLADLVDLARCVVEGAATPAAPSARPSTRRRRGASNSHNVADRAATRLVAPSTCTSRSQRTLVGSAPAALPAASVGQRGPRRPKG